ncbi:MAG: hypothetical protein NC225_03385 [Clostridium sp.]|nr:hypothetical protein [Clostridium sp.]MCM1398509.1 hypothetical protein [Clostridium sp.]MCM1460231.1 hypothetical protein [Bacteroides sp.]
MKRIYGLLLVMLVSMITLTGCGDDKLIMTTTENTRTTTEQQESREDTTEARTTEEASEADQALTLSMLHEANKGDVLLQNSAGVKIQFDYYYEDQTYDEPEPYSMEETYFIGFDGDGNYVQSYENSSGVVHVHDHSRGCWYISDDNGIHTRIYPEKDLSERLVDYYHNDTVYEPKEDGETEEIKDIYRQSGQLILETSVTQDSEQCEYTYVLDDDYKIISCECRVGDTVVMTETVSYNISFEMPSVVSELKDRTNERIITVKNVDYGTEYSYSVSSLYPVDFQTSGPCIYEDEACTLLFNNIGRDVELKEENGSYQDLTVYLKSK